MYVCLPFMYVCIQIAIALHVAWEEIIPLQNSLLTNWGNSHIFPRWISDISTEVQGTCTYYFL